MQCLSKLHDIVSRIILEFFVNIISTPQEEKESWSLLDFLNCVTPPEIDLQGPLWTRVGFINLH